MKKLTVNSTKERVQYIFIAAIICMTVFLQGGFFPSIIAGCGVLMCIICLFDMQSKVNIKKISFPVIFSLWYVFCTVRTGFVLEYAAKAMLPMILVIFFIIVTSLSVDMRRQILTVIIKISILIACLSVIMCAVSSIKNTHIERALFPFQYSNACGIYFALLAVISKASDDGFIKKFRIIFYIALLLTQSVGAVVLTVIVELMCAKSKKRTVVIAVSVAAFTVVFHSRIYESMGTFIERLLQIHDGALCIADNPIFGIGAGKWSETRNFYQTGFYTATLIHSSITQIAVDSGVVGLILFIISVVGLWDRNLFKNKECATCVAMFLLHSMMDFTMSFLGLDLLIILVAAQGYDRGSYKCINSKIRIPCISVILIAAVIFEYGLFSAKNIENLFKNENYSRVVQKYEQSRYIQHSPNAQLAYLKSLYNTGEHTKCAETIDGYTYKTTDMLILKSWCADNKVLLNTLYKQPYNEKIYDEIKEAGNEENKQAADLILKDAVNNMSRLGKMLYQRTEVQK